MSRGVLRESIEALRPYLPWQSPGKYMRVMRNFNRATHAEHHQRVRRLHAPPWLSVHGAGFNRVEGEIAGRVGRHARETAPVARSALGFLWPSMKAYWPVCIGLPDFEQAVTNRCLVTIDDPTADFDQARGTSGCHVIMV